MGTALVVLTMAAVLWRTRYTWTALLKPKPRVKPAPRVNVVVYDKPTPRLLSIPAAEAAAVLPDEAFYTVKASGEIVIPLIGAVVGAIVGAVPLLYMVIMAPGSSLGPLLFGILILVAGAGGGWLGGRKFYDVRMRPLPHYVVRRDKSAVVAELDRKNDWIEYFTKVWTDLMGGEPEDGEELSPEDEAQLKRAKAEVKVRIAEKIRATSPFDPFTLLAFEKCDDVAKLASGGKNENRKLIIGTLALIFGIGMVGLLLTTLVFSGDDKGETRTIVVSEGQSVLQSSSSPSPEPDGESGGPDRTTPGEGGP